MLIICVVAIIHMQLFFIQRAKEEKSQKQYRIKNQLRIKSTGPTWDPPSGVVKFENCDVPCYFEKNVPLVGRKVVFDDKGRSSTFMHTMEGPKHYPRSTTKGNYDGLSTVSMKSDIPLPYFSWAEYNIMSPPLDFDVAIKGSVFVARNCRSLNNRERLVKELGKYTRVDSLSSCMNNAPWPSGVDSSDKHTIMRGYLFYFAFENECSDDYITEKLWGALEAGALPVYFGAPNVLDYTPPNSIIDVNQFKNGDSEEIDYERLGKFLNDLMDDKEKYTKFHEWRASVDYPAKFKETYDFTHDHSICRACRWNLARHEPESFIFDHKTQKLI